MFHRLKKVVNSFAVLCTVSIVFGCGSANTKNQIEESKLSPARHISWMGRRVDTQVEKYVPGFPTKRPHWFREEIAKTPKFGSETAKKMTVLFMKGAAAVISEPLCQPVTSMVFTTMQAWGPIFYENKNNSLNILEEEIAWLLEKNCARDKVKVIRVAVYLNWEHPKRAGQGLDGPFAYYGTILTSRRPYVFLNHDPDGLKRFNRYNKQMIELGERLQARKRIRDKFTSKKPASFFDYCREFQAACAGAGALFLGSSISKSPHVKPELEHAQPSPTKPDVSSCLMACELWDASHRQSCKNQCLRY